MDGLKGLHSGAQLTPASKQRGFMPRIQSADAEVFTKLLHQKNNPVRGTATAMGTPSVSEEYAWS